MEDPFFDLLTAGSVSGGYLQIQWQKPIWIDTKLAIRQTGKTEKEYETDAELVKEEEDDKEEEVLSQLVGGANKK